MFPECPCGEGSMTPRGLIVADAPGLRRSASPILRKAGFETCAFSKRQAATNSLEPFRPSRVVVAGAMTADDIEWLSPLRERIPEVPVFIATWHGGSSPPSKQCRLARRHISRRLSHRSKDPAPSVMRDHFEEHDNEYHFNCSRIATQS